MEECKSEQKAGMDGWMYRRIDRDKKNRQTGRWTDGWTDGWKN